MTTYSPTFHEFTAPAGVIDHLHMLNNAGVHPERAGYDRHGNPFLVWLQSDGDTAWPVIAYLGDDSEAPIPVTEKLQDAYFPLYVIVPPYPLPSSPAAP